MERNILKYNKNILSGLPELVFGMEMVRNDFY